MDLHEIAQREAEFYTRLQAVKAALQPRDFEWYPYDSLGEKGDQRVLCLAESLILSCFGTETLLKGWHDVEPGGWRWTEKQFSVALPGLSRSGPATLRLNFGLPEVALERLGPVTLAATVNGTPLPAETYTHPGEHAYIRKVPAAITADAILVEFQLDKAQPPGLDDLREL